MKDTSRSRSRSKRKQEEKVTKIAFAAGSGSILGDCLLKMSFRTEGLAGAGAAAEGIRKKQEKTGGKSS